MTTLEWVAGPRSHVPTLVREKRETTSKSSLRVNFHYKQLIVNQSKQEISSVRRKCVVLPLTFNFVPQFTLLLSHSE